MTPINKILFGIGAAIVLIIAVTIIWLSLANAHLKTQLAQAQANGTACHLANDEFSATVAKQNKAVERLRSNGVALEKQAKASALAARKTADAYLASADKLRKLKPRGDACKAVENLFDRYLEGRQ